MSEREDRAGHPTASSAADLEYFSAIDGRRAVRPGAALTIEVHEQCARILAGLISGLRSAEARKILESVRARLSEWVEFEHPEHKCNPYEDALDDPFPFALPSELELVRKAMEQGYPDGAARRGILRGVDDASAAR